MRRYARKTWRRNGARSVGASTYISRAVEAPCPDCGQTFRFHDGNVRPCEHCQCIRDGASTRGTMPDGSVPRLIQRETVLQQCTGSACQGWSEYSGARYHALRDLDEHGRCEYCRAPGDHDPQRRCKVFAGTVRFYGFVQPLVVPLNPDGTVTVLVRDQGRYNEPWHERVSLDASPRWGSGWEVLDVAGELRAFRSNWDSSG